jgi:hypothetical protein
MAMGPSPPSAGRKRPVESTPTSPTENGGSTPRYLWSQSRTEVVLRVWAPPETKGKDVRISLTGEREARLEMTLVGVSEALVTGVITHPFKVDDETGELSRL